MTLRDLTGRQIYNLKRRSEKLRKKHLRETGRVTETNGEKFTWESAFSAGVKSTLEQIKCN